jgi:hypothetical protein
VISVTETTLRPAVPADLPLIFLLGVFAEQAAAAGHRLQHLGVHKDNPARALYEQAGYQRAGNEGDYPQYDLALEARDASGTPLRPCSLSGG